MDLTPFDTRWPAAIRSLLPVVVERDALLVWLQLYPLAVANLARRETDRADFERYYQLRGRYRLSEIADTSASFCPAIATGRPSKPRCPPNPVTISPPSSGRSPAAMRPSSPSPPSCS